MCHVAYRIEDSLKSLFIGRTVKDRVFNRCSLGPRNSFALKKGEMKGARELKLEGVRQQKVELEIGGGGECIFLNASVKARSAFVISTTTVNSRSLRDNWLILLFRFPIRLLDHRKGECRH